MRATPNIEYFNLLSGALTPAIIIVGLAMGFFLLMRFQRESNLRWQYERDAEKHHRMEAISISPKPDHGGFAFLDVEDSKKALFIDVMNGFSDFARLKGYNVEFAMETSTPGKVGIRFTILDEGVTVSTARVRADINEFIDRVRAGDDLSDMPMTVDPVEHSRLHAALQARFAALRAQAEMRLAQDQFYQIMASELRGAGKNYDSHPPVVIHVSNNGVSSMRDNYNATNSQNIAQGRDAKAITSGSTVLVGSSYAEKASQIGALKELEAAIQGAELPEDAKQTAIRNVQNAREEMEENDQPRGDEIGKWIGRANAALTTAGVAAGVLEKMHVALKAFGLN